MNDFRCFIETITSMSQPLPIYVVLIGETVSQVKSASKFFKLSKPGIGSPIYSAIKAPIEGNIILPSRIPQFRIDFWLCLDNISYSIAKKINSNDSTSYKYNRSFYNSILPEACVLLEYESEKQRNVLLKDWDKIITDAWVSTG